MNYRINKYLEENISTVFFLRFNFPSLLTSRYLLYSIKSRLATMPSVTTASKGEGKEDITSRDERTKVKTRMRIRDEYDDMTWK